MDMVKFLSPLFVLAFSLFIGVVFRKTPIFSLPLLALCFYLYHPNSEWIQGLILIFWMLFTIGYFRMQAISTEKVKVPKIVNIVMVSIGVCAAGLVFLLQWVSEKPLKTVVVMAGVIMVVYVILRGLLISVIYPLLVKKRTLMQTSLADYYIQYESASRGWGFYHRYIRFVGDPNRYEVDIFPFKKYRGNVDVPVKYIKCECLFGLSYIYSINMASGRVGKQSRWETSPSAAEYRKRIKVFRIVLLWVVLINLVLYSAVMNFRL